MIHKALHPKDHVNSQCVASKVVERELTSIEDYTEVAIQGLGECFFKKGQTLIKVAINRNKKNNTKTNRIEIIKCSKQKWKEKQFYRTFEKQRKEIVENCIRYNFDHTDK